MYACPLMNIQIGPPWDDGHIPTCTFDNKGCKHGHVHVTKIPLPCIGLSESDSKLYTSFKFCEGKNH